MRGIGFVLVYAFVLLGTAHTAKAQTSNAYLALDSFSFFFAEGVEAGGTVPTIAVPVTLTQLSGTSWSLNLNAEDLSLPPLTLPDGTSVQWSLLSPASGSISLSSETGSVSISGEFKAQSLEITRKAIHTLTFTTSSSSITVGSVTVSREGFPMDRESGYVQLVATASDPPGSQHGVPFYVVLSGRFTGTPSGFLAP